MSGICSIRTLTACVFLFPLPHFVLEKIFWKLKFHKMIGLITFLSSSSSPLFPLVLFFFFSFSSLVLFGKENQKKSLTCTTRSACRRPRARCAAPWSRRRHRARSTRSCGGRHRGGSRRCNSGIWWESHRIIIIVDTEPAPSSTVFGIVAVAQHIAVCQFWCKHTSICDRIAAI